MGDKGIPLGIWALWELISQPRKNFFGPDCGSLMKKEAIEGVLGTGTFSIVFLSKDSPSVLKASTFGSQAHVVHETSMLEKHGRVRSQTPHLADVYLPVLEEFKMVEFDLPNAKRMVPGLASSPKGIPVLAHFAEVMKGEDPTKFVDGIIKPLESALQYMHDKNVHHLDVTPKNLVVGVTVASF